MATDTTANKTIATLLVTLLYLPGSPAIADKKVLEQYIGDWDIYAETLRPERSTTTYSETYEWVLDQQFLMGKTGRKADGTQDVIYGTYDDKAKGYPFWIFSSSGTYIYLPPATWNERKRTMEWKNASDWDINFRSQCHFQDRDTRNCTLLMKDWKGKVLLDMKWRAVRRAE